MQPALLEFPVLPAHKGEQELLALKVPLVLTAWTELPEPQGQLVLGVLPVQLALKVSLELTEPLAPQVPLAPLALKASKAQLALKVPLERTEPPVLPVLTVRQVLRVRREPQDQASVSVVRLPLSAIFPHLRQIGRAHV